MFFFHCAVCDDKTPRRCNNQKYCDACKAHPRSWRMAYMGYGRKPPATWTPQLACAICDEVIPRRTGPQKYCDKCRDLGRSLTVAKYYKRHKRRILRQKTKYRATNRDAINAKQRQYNTDTKLERRTRAELRAMKETNDGRNEDVAHRKPGQGNQQGGGLLNEPGLPRCAER